MKAIKIVIGVIALGAIAYAIYTYTQTPAPAVVPPITPLTPALGVGIVTKPVIIPGIGLSAQAETNMARPH